MSLKEEWVRDKREAFERVLLQDGWSFTGYDLHGAEVYERGNVKLAVDDHGIFVYFFTDGAWRRVAGVSDAAIDQWVSGESCGNDVVDLVLSGGKSLLVGF